MLAERCWFYLQYLCIDFLQGVLEMSCLTIEVHDGDFLLEHLAVFNHLFQESDLQLPEWKNRHVSQNLDFFFKRCELVCRNVAHTCSCEVWKCLWGSVGSASFPSAGHSPPLVSVSAQQNRAVSCPCPCSSAPSRTLPGCGGAPGPFWKAKESELEAKIHLKLTLMSTITYPQDDIL